MENQQCYVKFELTKENVCRMDRLYPTVDPFARKKELAANAAKWKIRPTVFPLTNQ